MINTMCVWLIHREIGLATPPFTRRSYIDFVFDGSSNVFFGIRERKSSKLLENVACLYVASSGMSFECV